MNAARRHARRAGLLRRREPVTEPSNLVTLRHGNTTVTTNLVAGWTPSLALVLTFEHEVLEGEYLVLRLTPTPPPASDAAAAAV